MLFTAFAMVGWLGLLYVTQPNFMGGGLPPVPWWTRYQHLPGAMGLLVGLVWMVRIERAARDPERHRSFWRSRR